jgi:hypothetical protein
LISGPETKQAQHALGGHGAAPSPCLSKPCRAAGRGPLTVARALIVPLLLHRCQSRRERVLKGGRFACFSSQRGISVCPVKQNGALRTAQRRQGPGPPATHQLAPLHHEPRLEALRIAERRIALLSGAAARRGSWVTACVAWDGG